MKIVVLGGGISTERHVSLVTATSICKALRRRGHQAVFVDLFFGMENYTKNLNQAFDEEDGLCGDVRIDTVAPNLEEVRASRRYGGKGNLGPAVAEICRMADCVFLGLHGKDGEDGKIQGLLELIGVPYTGSGPLASALAMNKAAAKRILKTCDVLTPAWKDLYLSGEDADKPDAAQLEDVPLPCALKVVDGGSSIGVAFPKSEEELREAMREIGRFGSHLIAEEKIIGRELTVPVLGNRALSPIEIVPQNGGDFDYIAKYQSSAGGGAREICPAELTVDENRLLRETAEKVHASLGLKAVSRSDFMLDRDGRLWFLEVNTLPGMTPNSLIPRAAAVEGIGYDELCEEILRISLSEAG